MAIRWDECVGVGRWVRILALVLVVSILLHEHLLLGLIGVVFLQMLGRKWLAQ